MGSLNKVLYPWMNRKKPFWVTQEASPYVDEYITSENKTFLEQQRIDSLTSSTSPVITDQPAQVPWKPYVTQRCGLIAIKLGLYPMWTKTGKKIDCTIFQVGLLVYVTQLLTSFCNAQLIQLRNCQIKIELDGLFATQL